MDYEHNVRVRARACVRLPQLSTRLPLLYAVRCERLLQSNRSSNDLKQLKSE